MAESNNATATTTPTKSSTAIAARDAELMFRVVQNMKGKVSDVDWEQVAKDMNYKSATVASVRFRQVRKSMESSFESPTSAGSGGEPATPTKGPKTKPGKVAKAAPKGRTPKKGVAYPVKKGPKGGKSAAVITKEEDSGLDEMEDDGDDEIAPVAKREVSEDESYDMIDYGDEQ